MVCKNFEILDEMEIKKLPKRDYNMKKVTYNDYCRKVVYSWDEFKSVSIEDDDLNEREEIIQNSDYIEPHGKMLKFKNKYFDKNRLRKEYWEFDYSKDVESVFQKHFTLQDLLDYLGIVPFTPSVMINISPDWKESKLTTEFGKVTVLKKIIDDYMKEEWFDKWEYVIENGSNGDNIHAHIVAHVNPSRIKSCIEGFTYKYVKGKKVKKNTSHIGKCNHVQQLKKYASKVKGIQGCIKGNSIQSSILRNEELVKDKLLYLHEDTKPEGHKNKSIIKDGFVSGCL